MKTRIRTQLTPKEKIAVAEYKRTGKKRTAIKKAYDLGSQGGSPANFNIIADILANKVFKRPLVKKEIDRIEEYIWNRLKVEAIESVENLTYLRDHSKEDNIKLQASKDILNRSGFVPVTKSANLNINADISNIPD